ncbi:hypothetical protein KKC45_03580 [Patescibacteria group bacterium]|nr:hypothetical protein [Patescibacteria group bacterium]
MKKIKKYLIAFVVCFPFIPAFVLASSAPENFQGLIGRAVELISLMVPLLISASVLLFIYGIARYIYYGDSDTKREEGRNFMMWGIIALFVMVSIWPLVGIVRETIFGSSGDTVDVYQGNLDFDDSYDQY